MLKRTKPNHNSALLGRVQGVRYLNHFEQKWIDKRVDLSRYKRQPSVAYVVQKDIDQKSPTYTVCLLYFNGQTLCGVTKRCPTDDHNAERGRRIAFARAVRNGIMCGILPMRGEVVRKRRKVVKRRKAEATPTLTQRGTKRIHRPRFQPQDVRDIRQLCNKMPQVKVAKLYNTSEAVVSRIVHRKSYKEV